MSNTPNALAPGGAIPARVYARVPLEVITSTVPNAGRGIAVLGDVKEGDLIFSITNPPICIVGNGFANVVSKTCDNCFASKTDNRANALDHDSIPAQDNPELVSACDKCKMVYYCSEECQQAAWGHHHKAECAVLAEVHRRFAQIENCPQIVWGLTYRAVIRFMALRSKNMVTPEDYDEYLALCTNGSNTEEEEGLESSLKSLAVVLEACLRTQISENEMLMFVEKPNSHYFFEGNESRVRASRNITKGEELTFSYLPQTGEYEKRREILQRFWGIRCVCSFCTKCQWNFDFGFGRAPPESMVNLRAAIDTVYNNQPKPLDNLLFAIGVMEPAGLGYSIPSIFEAHQIAVLLHTRNNNVEQALKAALKIRFLIEPLQKPRLHPKDRLSTLFNIILLLQSPKQTEEAHAMCDSVLSFLRVMYVRDIKKCFGTDSAVYRHENSSFIEYAQQSKGLFKQDPVNLFGAGLSGFAFDIVRPGEDKKHYTANLNKLLEWAGLKACTWEQLSQ